MVESPPPVTVFRSLRLPVLSIWPYLTHPDGIERWLGPAEIEVATAGELAADLWNGDLVRAEIASLAPPNCLDLAWRSAGFASPSRVGLRLEHCGPGSRVRVTHEDLASPVERDHAAAWWTEALGALRASIHEERDASAWGDMLPIVLRAPLGRTAEDIWPLISTGRGFEKWLARAERFEAEPGGAFRFASRYRGAEVIEEGHVEAIETGRLVALAWEWTGQGWDDATRLELFLEPDAGGVALLLRHSGFERLAPDVRLAARRNYAAAWLEVLRDLRRLVALGPA
jgi:uncharacterized protein YndB with AHSA1/START domain